MMRDKAEGPRREAGLRPPPGEQGFMLLGLIVVIAIILLGLSVAAAKVAFSLRREREAESARRADQYVRAIRRFYIKNGHYPGAIEQLENTNRIRYLRQRYVDPLTGKADYRLIPVGQNKTTVKGFFGQPLAGIASTGLGSAAGMQSPGIGGPGGTTPTSGAITPGATIGPGAATGTGTTSGTGATTDTGGTTATGATTGTGATAGQTGTAGASGTTDTTGQTGFSSTPGGIGSGFPGSTGPFMGVGSSATGSSILEVNEQTTYQTWEFLYDPRIEKLRQAAALNAGASSVGAGSLGQTPGAFGAPSASPTSTPGGSTTPGGSSTGGGTTPTSPTPAPQP
jgi:type II secretory pathway pseudopilin PulG